MVETGNTAGAVPPPLLPSLPSSSGDYPVPFLLASLASSSYLYLHSSTFQSGLFRLLSNMRYLLFRTSSSSSSAIALALGIVDPTQKSVRIGDSSDNGSGNKSGRRRRRIAPPPPPGGVLLTRRCWGGGGGGGGLLIWWRGVTGELQKRWGRRQVKGRDSPPTTMATTAAMAAALPRLCYPSLPRQSRKRRRYENDIGGGGTTTTEEEEDEVVNVTVMMCVLIDSVSGGALCRWRWQRQRRKGKSAQIVKKCNK